MSLPAPLMNFGIHQITMSLLSDPSIMGTAKVIGDATPELSQEFIDNRGGSSAYPWGSAPGDADGSIAVIFKQYDKNILRILNSYISGSISENATGDVDGVTEGLTNLIGTTISDAVNGIASMTPDTATKTTLAFGEYIIKAVSASTFDLYLDTDITGLTTYVDDSLKINVAAITLPGTGGTVAYQGIEFTSGSGAAALNIGDMARFSVRPINTYNLTHYLNKAGSSQKEFRLKIAGEKVGNKIRCITFPKCIANGAAGLKFLRKDWATIEANIKILSPSVEDYIGKQEFLNR